MIAGVSAGLIIFGPHIKIVHFFTPQLNTVKLRDFTALGLSVKVVFPHYDREDLFKDDTNKSIEERIQEFELIENCRVTRLNDDEYLVMND